MKVLRAKETSRANQNNQELEVLILQRDEILVYKKNALVKKDAKILKVQQHSELYKDTQFNSK